MLNSNNNKKSFQSSLFRLKPVENTVENIENIEMLRLK